MTKHQIFVAKLAFVAAACLLATACGDDSTGTVGNNSTDTGWDVGPQDDSGTPDSATEDSGTEDSGTPDAESDADAAGDVLDAFGLTCGTPALAVVTTAPRIGSNGGSQVIADCPERQVPVGVTASVTNGFWDGALSEFILRCGALEITNDMNGG